MPIYDFSCESAHRFECMVAMAAPNPACPTCGARSRRRPGAVSLAGLASAGRPASAMPQTWRGTHGGDREYVASLRRELDRRTALVERHPELQGDRRPVVAHEGRFARAPLYAGDPMPTHQPHATPAHAGGNEGDR